LQKKSGKRLICMGLKCKFIADGLFICASSYGFAQHGAPGLSA
jgi:hypothetical protein